VPAFAHPAGVKEEPAVASLEEARGAFEPNTWFDPAYHGGSVTRAAKLAQRNRTGSTSCSTPKTRAEDVQARKGLKPANPRARKFVRVSPRGDNKIPFPSVSIFVGRGKPSLQATASKFFGIPILDNH